MLVQYYYPFSLSPNRLDRYLAAGWFRNSIMLFRSKMLCMDGNLFDVINIRLGLNNYSFPKKYRKLLFKNKDQFRYEVKRASITKQKEALYKIHKTRFKGFIYDSLRQFLYSDTFSSVFQTFEINVYDGDQLIAFSYFDKGNHSIASLLGVFDPNYAKYSLGTYTMLLEIEYAIQNNHRFYYPGYIFNKPSMFDYKLKLGEHHYYDWNGKWRPFKYGKKITTYTDKLNKQINYVVSVLLDKNVCFQKKLYPLFPLGYMEKTMEPFVKGPVLMFIDKIIENDQLLILEYLPEENIYSLAFAKRCPEYNQIIRRQQSSLNDGESFMSVLKYDQFIVKSSKMEDVIRYL